MNKVKKIDMTNTENKGRRNKREHNRQRYRNMNILCNNEKDENTQKKKDLKRKDGNA